MIINSIIAALGIWKKYVLFMAANTLIKKKQQKNFADDISRH
jgi:hypothetical protein